MTLHAALKVLVSALAGVDARPADQPPEPHMHNLIEAARLVVGHYERLRDGTASAHLWIFAKDNFSFHRNGGDLTAWRRVLDDGWEILITDPTGTRCELGEGETWIVRAYHPDRPAEDSVIRTESSDPRAALQYATIMAGNIAALGKLPKVRASQ